MSDKKDKKQSKTTYELEKTTVRVLPHETDGKKDWQVKTDGNKKASIVTSTQKEAEVKGRQIAKNKDAEFAIHGKDGKIRQKDSEGHDPRKIKG